MLRLFPRSQFKTAKILVVDDSATNLKVICAKLAASGYTQVETAVDGYDALKVGAHFRPDLVLLDIMMPNLDGFGYLERIRSDNDMPHMPIIVQTALSERDAKLRALGCGADDFLNKPLDLEEVALRVHIHLERYFILQHIDGLRDQLKQELDRANATIRRMETELSQAGRELLTQHYDALRSLTGPLGSQLPAVTNQAF